MPDNNNLYHVSFDDGTSADVNYDQLQKSADKLRQYQGTYEISDPTAVDPNKTQGFAGNYNVAFDDGSSKKVSPQEFANAADKLASYNGTYTVNRVYSNVDDILGAQPQQKTFAMGNYDGMAYTPETKEFKVETANVPNKAEETTIPQTSAQKPQMPGSMDYDEYLSAKEGIEKAGQRYDEIKGLLDGIKVKSEAASKELEDIVAPYRLPDGTLGALPQAVYDAAIAKQDEIKLFADQYNELINESNGISEGLKSNPVYASQKSADQLSAINRQIAELREQRKHASGAEKDNINSLIANLKDKRKELQRELEANPATELGYMESAATIDAMKAAANTARESMGRTSADFDSNKPMLDDFNVNPNFNSDDYRNDTDLMLTQGFYNDAKKEWQAPQKYSDDKMEAVGEGALSRLTDPNFWVMGLRSAEGNMRVAEIYKKIENDEELTPIEEKVLEAYNVYQYARASRAQDTSTMYKAGAGAADLAMLTLEMAATGALGGEAISATLKSKLMRNGLLQTVLKSAPTTAAGKALRFAAKEGIEFAVSGISDLLGKTLVYVAMTPDAYTTSAEKIAANEQLRAENPESNDVLSAGKIIADTYGAEAATMYFLNAPGKLLRSFTDIARTAGMASGTEAVEKWYRELAKAQYRAGSAASSSTYALHSILGPYGMIKGAAFNQLTGLEPEALDNFFDGDNFSSLMLSLIPGIIKGAVKQYAIASEWKAARAEAERLIGNAGVEGISILSQLPGMTRTKAGLIFDIIMSSRIREGKEGTADTQDLMRKIYGAIAEGKSAELEGAINGIKDIAEMNGWSQGELALAQKHIYNMMESARRYQSFDGEYKGMQETLRAAKQKEISDKMGGAKFWYTDKKGKLEEKFVTEVRLKDGRLGFVVNANEPTSEGKYGFVTEGSSTVEFISPEQIAGDSGNKVMRTSLLRSYLEERVIRDESDLDYKRYTDYRNETMRDYQPGQQVEVPTLDGPMSGVVSNVTETGLTVIGPDGIARPYSVDEVASWKGREFKTSDQIANEEGLKSAQLAIDMQRVEGQAEESLQIVKDNGELPVDAQTAHVVEGSYNPGTGEVVVAGLLTDGRNYSFPVPAEKVSDAADEIKEAVAAIDGQQAMPAETAGVAQPLDVKAEALRKMTPSEESYYALRDPKLGLSETDIRENIDANLKEAEKVLNALSNAKPKMGTDADLFVQQRAEYEAKVAEAQANVEKWNRVSYVARLEERDAVRTTPEAIAKLREVQDVIDQKRGIQTRILTMRDYAQQIREAFPDMKEYELAGMVREVAGMVDAVRESRWKKNLAIRLPGFSIRDKVFIFAEFSDPANVQALDSTNKHETQHVHNRTDRTVIDAVINAVGGDRDALESCVLRMAGLKPSQRNPYSGKDIEYLADEFSAWALQDSEVGEGLNEARMTNAGIPEDLINVIREEYGRQQDSNYWFGSGRIAHDNGDQPGAGQLDGRNPLRGSAEVGEQGYGSPARSDGQNVTPAEAVARKSSEELHKQSTPEYKLGQQISEGLSGGMETADGNTNPVHFSASAILEGAGLEALTVDESGERKSPILVNGDLVAILPDGTKVNGNTAITGEQLSKIENSTLRYMMNDALALGYVNPENEARMWDTYASMVNAILKKGLKENGGFAGLDKHWQWVGETVYKTVASNSDKQYSWSLDITRVCKKNEAVIKAIAEYQKRLGYGITPGQIMNIYLESNEEGYQVPCPVCYVFSRYINNGKYATIMINGQKKYGDRLVDPSTLTEEEKAEKVQMWLDLLDEVKAENEKNSKAITAAKNAMKYSLATIDKIGRQIMEGNMTDAQVEKAKARMEILDARYRAALDVVSQSGLDGWITKFAIKKSSKDGVETWDLYDDTWQGFPEEVALDLRKTNVAMTDYPAIQRYRNSRGAGAGKEITFAADNRLGEVAMMLGKGPTPNYYEMAVNATNEGERNAFLAQARKRLEAAHKYAVQQSLRGGQRMWSWSDNIERLSPDVFMNLFTLEILRGALQSYSKQLEGIKLVATMNGYVNGSLMGKGIGYREVTSEEIENVGGRLYLKGADFVAAAPGEKPVFIKTPVYENSGKYYTLEFDKVVGIDPFGEPAEDGHHLKGLFELNETLSKAGNILVGMNDIHIRTAMADDRVYFIIPWHASGNDVHILKQMLSYLGVDLENFKPQDYTNVQEEKTVKAVSAKLRKLWEEHKNETDFPCGIEGGIESGSNGELSKGQQLYKKIRDAIFVGAEVGEGESATTVPVESVPEWMTIINNDVFLSQVYNKVRSTDVGEMTKEDCNHIYPYEYWDEKSTYWNADVNGARYLEYCRRLGYKPKFCGTLSSGGKDFGNFVNDRGYWKLLIDRRMYDVNGVFQDLTPVSSEKFTPDIIDPVKTAQEFKVTRVADDAGTNTIVDNVMNKEANLMAPAGRENDIPMVDYGTNLTDAVEKFKQVSAEFTKSSKSLNKAEKEAFNLNWQVESDDISGITPEVREEMDVIEAAARVDGTWMKGKDGKTDSKLDENQWALVRTKNFKEWFGDWENDPENASKIVDPETGEPMVVYHGSTYAGDIDAFFETEGAIWASEDEEYAKIYALDWEEKTELKWDEEIEGRPKPEAGVLGLFMKIINPFDAGNIEGDVDSPEFDAIAEKLGMTGDELAAKTWNNYPGSVIYESTRSDAFSEILKKKGYDGIFAKEGFPAKKSFGALSPNQIKSATGNNGEFSRRDNDIRFQVTPEQDADYMSAVNSGDMEKARQMVDNAAKAAGYTIRGEHGRVSKFNIFDKAKAYPEGNWGAGFYFSNNEEDVLANYANENGPDLKTRIEREVEKLQFEDEYADIPEDELIKQVTDRLVTAEPNVVHSAIKMENPFVVGHGMVVTDENGEPKYDMQETYLTCEYETDEDGEIDYDVEPTGTLVDIALALDDIVESYGVRSISPDIIYDNYDGMTAGQFEKEVRELLVNYEDNLIDWNGDLITSEVIRAAIEEAGFDGIIDNTVSIKFPKMKGMNRTTRHYIAFNPEQIKVTDPVTYDDNGNVIPLSQRFNESNADIRWQVENENQSIFVSNAEQAVEGLNMGKASPEMWLKAIQGKGGLKAGEDKWLGLSEWLTESGKKSITKEELLDFIRENRIQIEETSYQDEEVSVHDKLIDKYGDIIDEAFEFSRDFDPEEGAVNVKDLDKAVEFYNQQNPMTPILEEEYEDEYTLNDKLDTFAFDLASEAAGEVYSRPINSTRMNYTTYGLENKREIALTVPTIEPYKANDGIHFGDAGDGRAIAWVRFGETTATTNEVDTERGWRSGDIPGMRSYKLARVLVIDEIQSKRHQDARDVATKKQDALKNKYGKDWESLATKEELEDASNGYADKKALLKQYEEASNIHREYMESMVAKYGEQKVYPLMNTEERIKARELQKAREYVRKSINETYHTPDVAPFEKNWHELAFKRMLRLAAEEGYDKVAWTNGDMQAERYNLGGVVDYIRNEGKSHGLTSIVIRLTNDDLFAVDVNENGTIAKRYDNENREIALGDYKDKALGDIIGKELAVRAMSLNKYEKIEGDGLRIGGEGMRGFYDDILPRFASKYGKKWGAKVEDIDLPVGEGKWHSIDVTPEMKESVMQGQPMFQVAPDTDIRFQIIGEKGAELDKTKEGIARLDNLDVAREMENELNPDWTAKDNESALRIKMATGWERGADGKWRYEQPDPKFNGMLSAYLASYKLSDLIDDKRLFTQYPSMKDVTVTLNNRLKSSYGSANEKNNSIELAWGSIVYKDNLATDRYSQQQMWRTNWELNDKVRESGAADIPHKSEAEIEKEYKKKFGVKYLKDMTYEQNLEMYAAKAEAFKPIAEAAKKVLTKDEYPVWLSDHYPVISEEGKLTILHEVQHLIQGIEGFAKGGNENMVDPKFQEESDRISKEMIGLPWEKAKVKYKEWMSFNSKHKLGYEGYKKLGGEVESRNVEKRNKMSLKKRRETLLASTEDIAREDQVILMDSLNESQSKEAAPAREIKETSPRSFKVGNDVTERDRKYGVGKRMGGVYFHKDYAADVLPDGLYEKAQALLPDGFEYKTLYYDEKTPAVLRFDEAPDFDTAREPIVGDYVKVNVETGDVTKGHNNSIWHHKWEWVKDDYTGFDVQEAYDWSKKWKSTFPAQPKGIGSKRVWDEKLAEVGLPIDGENKPSKVVDIPFLQNMKAKSVANMFKTWALDELDSDIQDYVRNSTVVANEFPSGMNASPEEIYDYLNGLARHEYNEATDIKAYRNFPTYDQFHSDDKDFILGECEDFAGQIIEKITDARLTNASWLKDNMPELVDAVDYKRGENIMTPDEVRNLLNLGDGVGIDTGNFSINTDRLLSHDTAYHGTGSEFDKFESGHELEGEGAMVHGFGTYLTFSEPTARTYAKKLGEPKMSRADYVKSQIEVAKAWNIPAQVEYWTNELNSLQESGIGRFLYTVSLPKDNGHNYIDEMKSMAKMDRKRIADYLRSLPEDMLHREEHGPNWLPNGWNTVANYILNNSVAGKEIREKLVDACGSEEKTSMILNEIGFVGYKYDGRKDGECAVIFDPSNIRITDKVQFQVEPEYEAEYMAAVNSGDMEKAQQMVDEVAKNWGTLEDSKGRIKKLWHFSRTGGGFNVFNIPAWFSRNENYAMEFFWAKPGTSKPFYIKEGSFIKLKPIFGREWWKARDIANQNWMLDQEVLEDILGTEEGWNADELVENETFREYLRKNEVKYVLTKELGYDEYIVIDANNIKSADPVTYDDNGNVIPLSERFNVNSNDIRFMTSSELDEAYPNWMDNQVPDPEKDGKRGQSTQVAGTLGTYKKVGSWVEKNLPAGTTVLDASSGMGLGSKYLREQGFDVLDIEPYPGADRMKNSDTQPDYYGPTAYQLAIDNGEQVDFVISNAVLNVIPDDWRRDVLHNMDKLLKPGGKMFINTRPADNVKGLKNKIELDSPTEVLVGTPDKITSYQKFYTVPELIEYVQSELGPAYKVEKANVANSGTSGLAAVVVTKPLKLTTADDVLSAGDDVMMSLWNNLPAEARDEITANAMNNGGDFSSAVADKIAEIDNKAYRTAEDEAVVDKTAEAIADTMPDLDVVKYSVFGDEERQTIHQNSIYETVERIKAEGLDSLMGGLYNDMIDDVRQLMPGNPEDIEVAAYISDISEKTQLNDVDKKVIGIAQGYLEQAFDFYMDTDDARWMLYNNTHGNDQSVLDRAHNIVVGRTFGYGKPAYTQGEKTIKEFLEESAKLKDDFIASYKAMRQIVPYVQSIGADMVSKETYSKAVSARKEYDQETVKKVVNLARMLTESKLLDSMSNAKVQQLMNVIRNSNGRKDITGPLNDLYEIVLDNQLARAGKTFEKVLSVKGDKVDSKGVVVMGKLDAEGNELFKAFRDNYKSDVETISNNLAEQRDKINDEFGAVRYAGIELAKDYREKIRGSKDEYAGLIKELDEAKKQHMDGTMSDDVYREFRKTMELEKIANKQERLDDYMDIVQRLMDVSTASQSKAIEWAVKEQEHINEIYHNANSDMEGRTDDPRGKEPGFTMTVANGLAGGLLAPLATFDQMLRMFGSKNVKGEGYLWNRFMRGWVDAAGNQFKWTDEAYKTLDAKVSEVMGKDMRWSDLYDMEKKLPGMTLTYKIGPKEYEEQLTQGNLLYIYMVNKMIDGQVKLRKMGIDDATIDQIVNILDPRFIELADWIQDAFLPERRKYYNEVYQRLNGAPMSSIDNYFPLRVNSRVITKDMDISSEENEATLSSTITRNLIKRVRNSRPLDIRNADAFSVVIEHIQEMERWRAFSEWTTDLNTLLSYTRFKNQVSNMTSIYGSGDKLWKTFTDVARVAAGTYKGKGKTGIDKFMLDAAKGVTAAKISLRLYTAMKQFSSFPAYFGEASTKNLMQSLANPAKSWKWAMENLPVFEKRWKSRQAGDHILSSADEGFFGWRNDFAEAAARVGMSPNAFVDALTVSMGSWAIYKTKYDNYIKLGYGRDAADQRAKQDAVILYNETQQSNENAFLSPIQMDRSWMSASLTVFRNSSMGYQRQEVDAIRNLHRMAKKGYKEESIEFMTKQMIRDGIDESKAAEGAKRIYNRQKFRDMFRTAQFGYLMQFAWYLMPVLPYLFLGDDDDVKMDMAKETATHAMFGSVEGLAGGNVISDLLNMKANGETISNYDFTLMPFASDMKNLASSFGNDQVKGINDIVSLMFQIGVGVNPQTITDAAVAVYDACQGDLDTTKEVMFLAMRIAQIPQNQIQQLYIDEIQMKASDAKDLSIEDLAKRYADYKILRGTPLTKWMYSEDEIQKLEERYGKRLLQDVKERNTRKATKPELDRKFKEMEDHMESLRKKAIEGDVDAWNELNDIILSKDYVTLQRYKSMNDQVGKAADKAISEPDINKMQSYLQRIVDLSEQIENEFQDEEPELAEKYTQFTAGIFPEMQKIDKQYKSKGKRGMSPEEYMPAEIFNSPEYQLWLEYKGQLKQAGKQYLPKDLADRQKMLNAGVGPYGEELSSQKARALENEIKMLYPEWTEGVVKRYEELKGE